MPSAAPPPRAASIGTGTARASRGSSSGSSSSSSSMSSPRSRRLAGPGDSRRGLPPGIRAPRAHRYLPHRPRPAPRRMSPQSSGPGEKLAQSSRLIEERIFRDNPLQVVDDPGWESSPDCCSGPTSCVEGSSPNRSEWPCQVSSLPRGGQRGYSHSGLKKRPTAGRCPLEGHRDGFPAEGAADQRVLWPASVLERRGGAERAAIVGSAPFSVWRGPPPPAGGPPLKRARKSAKVLPMASKAVPPWSLESCSVRAGERLNHRRRHRRVSRPIKWLCSSALLLTSWMRFSPREPLRC